MATIHWTYTGAKIIEVRVGAPDGLLFVTAASASGSKKTGDWVKGGSVFYLQNGAKDVPRTLDNTIARLEVQAVEGPCK